MVERARRGGEVSAVRGGEWNRTNQLRHIPITQKYSRTMRLVEEADRLCVSRKGIRPGRTVLALMVDALSENSPLFRFLQTFANLDTELLHGEPISPEELNDDAVGRELDRLYTDGGILSCVVGRSGHDPCLS